MRQTLTGKVTSAASNKTITIKVDSHKTHPLYHKAYKASKKFYAHDEKEQAKAGDVVKIGAIAPISKTKRWELLEIVEKSKE